MPQFQIEVLVQVMTFTCVTLISCQLICLVPVHNLNGPELRKFILYIELKKVMTQPARSYS